MHLKAQKPAPGGRIGLTDWLQAILEIACLTYPDLSGQEAFGRVMAANILKHAPKEEDHAGAVVMRPEVQQLLDESRWVTEFLHILPQDQANLKKPTLQPFYPIQVASLRHL